VIHPGWVRTEMGGAAAVVEVAASVSSVLRVVHGLTAAQNGGFLDLEGRRIPW